MNWWRELIALAAMMLLLIIVWSITHAMYKRIYGVEIVWWARPLTHGSLLFVQRLDPRFERPLRKKR